MIELYKSLNHLIHVNCIDLSDVKTFNLDEYININSNHEQSYKTYMYNNFIKQNKTFNEENFFIPNGNADDLQTEIERYEKLIKHYGYIDLQILGIGENGHIGFNEPGTAFTSKTHIVI